MAGRGSTRWHGYGVLSQSLTILGVERLSAEAAATVVSLELWIIVPAGLFSLPAGINQTRATLAALQHKPVRVAAP